MRRKAHQKEKDLRYSLKSFLVAGAGFEPTTFGLWARRATRLLHPAILNYKRNTKISASKRRRPDLNWWSGSCSPMPYHLATTPYQIICSFRKKMTPTGFEPVLPPWKGGVLTTWPWSLILMTASRSMQYLKYYETPRAGLEPATARLTAVCSTNWAIEDYYKVYSYYIIYLQNNIQESFYISYTSAFFG